MIRHLHGDHVIVPADLVAIGIRVDPVYVAAIRRGCLVSLWENMGKNMDNSVVDRCCSTCSLDLLSDNSEIVLTWVVP